MKKKEEEKGSMLLTYIGYAILIMAGPIGWAILAFWIFSNSGK